jgi:general secretion pathway protein D
MRLKVNVLKKLWFYAALACALVLLAWPLAAHTKKGDKLLKEGEKAEQNNDYDTALSDFDQALDTDSKEPAYLIAVNRVRMKAAEADVRKGRTLQRQQKLDEALVQFQKALLADPSYQVALQEIRVTNDMIRDKAKAPPGTVILTPAERARRDVEKRINSLEGAPTLRPINDQISSLKMNNQPPRVLYESVCKLAGINALFDPLGIEGAGGARNVNLDLSNVSLNEALNYVALVTHTFWQPISHNAIFVTQEAETKRREYQNEVVKVFYIQNASTPNEFTEIFNGVRIGVKLQQGIFQVASQNAIVARGSPDTIALVEKLIHDLDRPKPEVLVDVVVMEVSKSKITTLGAALAGQTGGLNIPILYNPRNPVTVGGTKTGTTTGTTTPTTGTTTGTGTDTTGGTSGIGGLNNPGTSGTPIPSYVALSQLGHISSADFATTLPGALVQALLTDASTRLLQRPEIRATDGGKASLKIGSKIPYVQGSLNSAVATPGSIPYATTQFQSVDVGVQIELSPHVNGPDDVSMHIKVEISNVTQTENIAGVQEPIIGQKVNEADIRMKDGEVSLLGGLTSNSNSLSIAGIPGVANIPLLGYLFGTRSRDRETDDIIVALIPHIIRASETTEDASSGVYAGTEQVQRVEHHADGAASPYSGSASGGPVGNPVQGVSSTPTPGTYEQEPPQEPDSEPPQYPTVQPEVGGQAVQPPILRPRPAPPAPSSPPPR